MKRREFVLGLGSAFATIGMLPPEALAAGASSYMLGNTEVKLNVLSSGGGPTFFAPHSNETTAISAAKAAVQANGGRAFWLTHGGGRNITFKLEGKTYVVDPNRMFSDKGAKASLQKLSTSSPEAVKAVRGLAAFVLNKLFAGTVRPLVGIHNNTNGSYSAQSYKNGADKASAKEVYIHEGLDTDDFFFVTSKAVFETIKKKGFNVVLQASRIADDGSLSVFCQKKGVPYINVEAQEKHSGEQQKMLKVLYEV